MVSSSSSSHHCTKNASAANAKRSSISSTMATGAAVFKLRAKFGGGATSQVRPALRGSAEWLRNRDAAYAAAVAASTDAPPPPPRRSARFERRAPQLRPRQLMQQLREAATPSPPARAAAVRPRAAQPLCPALRAPADQEKKKGEGEEVEAEDDRRHPLGDEEDGEEEDGEEEGVKEEGASAAAAASGGRPPEVCDGVSEAERVAWRTWHLSPEELVAAGYSLEEVRAPEVLAAARTRFLHNPNIMINSNFDCGFSVNQTAFKNILRDVYGFSATYAPVKYPGMLCPFLLRRGVPLEAELQPGYCDPEDRDLDTKSAAFARKYVKATFIIFRTGNAFLRGRFSKEVMEFVYQRFKHILATEYPQICTRFTCPDTKDSNAVVKTRVAYFSVTADGGSTSSSSSSNGGGAKDDDNNKD